jgi:hypothetical protein
MHAAGVAGFAGIVGFEDYAILIRSRSISWFLPGAQLP